MSTEQELGQEPELVALPPLTQVALAYRLLERAIATAAEEPQQLEAPLLGAAQFAWQILEDELVRCGLA